ncbi:hypothetical protein JNB_16831 [Janibacter sp. HTCC2649]|nr:hypothetical protein JNB_16831 [Janibacter sp. HTCC2649]
MTWLPRDTEMPRSHQELPVMSFRDAQGNRWYRNELGKLTPHKPGTAPADWMDAESHPEDSKAVGWGID